MSAQFILLELTVSDWRRSLEWYRAALGLVAELTDEANRYALLSAGITGLSLKEGIPEPGNTVAYFEVVDLDAALVRATEAGADVASPPKTNPAEGYRRAILRDPDGYRIGLFEYLSS